MFAHEITLRISWSEISLEELGNASDLSLTHNEHSALNRRVSERSESQVLDNYSNIFAHTEIRAPAPKFLKMKHHSESRSESFHSNQRSPCTSLSREETLSDRNLKGKKALYKKAPLCTQSGPNPDLSEALTLAIPSGGILVAEVTTTE